MVILDRYFFRGFISTFLFCLLLLWILYVLGDIFGFLDEILRERIPVSSLVRFYTYLTPFIITQITPISTLIACVYLLGNLNRHSEITAIRASGISIWKALRTVLVASFVISIFVFIVNDKLLPPAMRKANRIRYEKLDVGKRGKAQSIKIDNVAIYGYGNRIIFARKFDIKQNVLDDVIIHRHDRQHDLILRTSAKKIYWKNKKWRGEEVVAYRMDSTGEFVGEPVIYEKIDMDILETPTDFINNQWKPEYMSYAQLRKYIRIFAAGGQKSYRRLLVDLHYKLAFPFACMATILISAPFSLSTKRGGALLGMATGIVIALLYIPVMAVGLALGKGGALPPFISAWFSNILFGGIGIYLLSKF